ncbi:MAG: hypothetical protein AAFP84_03680 [Actinomycetota bacterium]
MTRPRSRYLVRALRAAAREAVWLTCCRHEQGDRPNILLFATRRGGSTFAMELIGANRGVRPMNQPLETQSDNLTLAQALEIPRFRQGQITSLAGAEEERIERLVHALFDGEVVINAPTTPWRRDVDIVSDRVVLKLLDSKPVIGWFDERFDADIVYLTRHPIPQSISCIRNGWTLTVDAHLDDREFVDRWLTAATLAAAHDVMSSGSELDSFVLNWILENLAPLRLLPSHPDWLHVRYEDCVLDPVGTFERMADRLQLTDTERMREVLTRPSQSSRRSTADTRQAIESGEREALVVGWRDRIDADVELRINRLLETFEIDPAVLLPADVAAAES